MKAEAEAAKAEWMPPMLVAAGKSAVAAFLSEMVTPDAVKLMQAEYAKPTKKPPPKAALCTMLAKGIVDQLKLKGMAPVHPSSPVHAQSSGASPTDNKKEKKGATSSRRASLPVTVLPVDPSGPRVPVPLVFR